MKYVLARMGVPQGALREPLPEGGLAAFAPDTTRDSDVRAQVVEDANEALAKYGGDITLRRPEGPLAPLYDRTVKVEKVTLVYDKAYVKTTELENLIRDAAAGVKINGQKVEVVFR